MATILTRVFPRYRNARRSVYRRAQHPLSYAANTKLPRAGFAVVLGIKMKNRDK